MNKKPGANTVTVLYAVKVGQPNHMEEVLFEQQGWVNVDEVRDKGKKWADANGYDRLRISVIDMTTPPDFAGTVKI